jgi:hypothetical protein
MRNGSSEVQGRRLDGVPGGVVLPVAQLMADDVVEQPGRRPVAAEGGVQVGNRPLNGGRREDDCARYLAIRSALGNGLTHPLHLTILGVRPCSRLAEHLGDRFAVAVSDDHTLDVLFRNSQQSGHLLYDFDRLTPFDA